MDQVSLEIVRAIAFYREVVFLIFVVAVQSGLLSLLLQQRSIPNLFFHLL